MSNSRAQKRANQTWRRRVCLSCNGVFTSVEGTDYALSLIFKGKMGRLQPFSRDKLFISVYEACKHRKDANEAATALTATIIGKLLARIEDASLKREYIIIVSTEVLKRFDNVAATYYGAYHPL